MNCPKCGAELKHDNGHNVFNFDCGSCLDNRTFDASPDLRPVNWITGRVSQSNKCTTTQRDQLQAEVERYRKLLDEVACSGVEFSAEGLGYVSIQIDSDTWDEIRALAEGEG